MAKEEGDKLSQNSSDIVTRYLEDLRSSVMWGNCAGNTTRLDHLHHNRLINRELMVDSCISFFKIIDALNNVRDIVEFDDGIRDLIINLHLSLNDSKWYDAVDKATSAIGQDSINADDYEMLGELAETILSSDSGLSDVEGEMGVLVRSTTFSEAIIGKIDSAIKIFLKLIKTFIEKAERGQDESFSQSIQKIAPSMGILSKHSREIKHFHSWDEEENTDVFGDTKRCWEMLRYGAIDLHHEINSLRDYSENSKTKAGIGFTVYGDPGWGKTILLRQHGYNLANALLHEEPDEILPNEGQEGYIPVYLKGKVLIKHVESLSPYEWEIGMPVDDDSQETFLMSELNNLQKICINAILESEKELDKEIVTSFIHDAFEKKRNILFLIDAYDEVPNRESRINLINFMHEQFRLHGNRCILTSRFTHREELEEFSEIISDIGGWGEIRTLEIHFTNHECQYEMPIKLANAWGSDSGDIEYYVSESWQEYRDVLNTPLFVGLFCMLISEGHLHEMGSSVAGDGLLRTRSRKSVINQYGERVIYSEKPVTMPHVMFLRKVIDFGLKENIQNRKQINEGVDLGKLRKIVLYVAATHKILNLNSVNVILKYIQKIHSIKLTTEELKIFKEDLGIMFVNSENDIEWTHPTLPEVALGMLISEDTDYRNYLESMHGSIFGPRDVWWSECLILTLISNNQISRQDLEFHPLFELVKMFPKMGGRSVRNTLYMFSPLFKNFKFTMIELNFYKKEFEFKVECRRPELLETAKSLGKLYFGAIVEGRPFPLPLRSFDLDDYSEGNFFSNIFERSNDEFASEYFTSAAKTLNIFAHCKYQTIVKNFGGDFSRLAIHFLSSLERYESAGHVEENLNAFIRNMRATNFQMRWDTKNWSRYTEKVLEMVIGEKLINPQYFRLYNEVMMAQQRFLEGEKLSDGDRIDTFRNNPFTESLIHRFDEWDSDSDLYVKMKKDIARIHQINDYSPELGFGDTQLLEEEYFTVVYYQIISLLITGKYDHRSHSIIHLDSILQIVGEWGFTLNSSAGPSRLQGSRWRIRRDPLPLQPAMDFSTINGLNLMETLIDGAPNWFVTLMLSEVAKSQYRRRIDGPHSRT